MRVALVSQEYPPETARGGIGSQTYAKAKGLTALGHKVYVVTRSIDGKRHQNDDGNISIIRIPGMETLFPLMTSVVEWISHSIVVAAEVERLHKEEGLDIVDFPEWGAEAYTYLLNRNEWNKVPAVIQLHGPLVMLAHAIGWPEINSDFYRIGFNMEAECVRLADGVYSSSECSAEWIRMHYDKHRQHIPIIHMGVDTEKFSPKTFSKNQYPTIVFAGKIVQNKGVVELVVAASALVKEFPNLRLRLLGKGEEKFINYLREIALKNNAPNLLEFPGFIHSDQLPEEFSKAHVFAAPSHYEGGPGFVYLEAMACGLPVIACSGSGVEEIIEEGENGFLVSPRDVDALISAMQKLFSDNHRLENMGKKAREYTVGEADTRLCVEKLETLYYSVVQQKKMAKQ